jgi:hypothetical protein
MDTHGRELGRQRARASERRGIGYRSDAYREQWKVSCARHGIRLAEPDGQEEARRKAAADELRDYWSSIPDERFQLVRKSYLAKKRLEYIEGRLAGGAVEELTEAITQLAPAVAAFSRQREALAACQHRFFEILERVSDELFSVHGPDDFRVARVKRLRLLKVILERTVSRANAEATRDEMRRLMSESESGFSEDEEMLRTVYALSEKERSLVSRRAEALRNDKAPWPAADRVALHRLRQLAARNLDAKKRLVT